MGRFANSDNEVPKYVVNNDVHLTYQMWGSRVEYLLLLLLLFPAS